MVLILQWIALNCPYAGQHQDSTRSSTLATFFMHDRLFYFLWIYCRHTKFMITFFWWSFTKLKFSICDHQNFHYVNYAKTCFKNLVCISPQNIKWAIFKRLGYTLHFYVMKPKLLRNRILCQSATYHAWTYWENWKPGQFDVCM